MKSKRLVSLALAAFVALFGFAGAFLGAFLGALLDLLPPNLRALVTTRVRVPGAVAVVFILRVFILDDDDSFLCVWARA